MLKRKLSAMILVATITNFASAPMSVFAETLTTNNIQESEIQESNNQSKIATVSKINLSDSDYKDTYNEVFKIKNESIYSITNNGGQYSSSNINRAIDGNLSTHWETGKPNSSNFTNEVIVNFKEITNINRIIYLARRDEGGKGFAKEFEIYASLTDNQDDFVLVSEGSYNGSTSDTIEIKFDSTNFKRLKFKFKNAYNNWVSAAEFMFYKEDSLYNKLNNIFTNGLMNELSENVNTLEKLTALENELNNYPLKEKYASKIELAKKVLENPAKYQEGILTASQRGDSNKEASEHKVARTSYNLDTFGKYVTPGEIVNVYVDADANGVMPKLVFGQLADDKNGWTRFYDLKPGLNTIVAPQFNTMSPAVIYVYNPALPSDQSYAPKVRLEGGTAFPVYYHGVTDPADYEKELEEFNKKVSVNDNDFANGIRNDVYYNVTELVSENNIITTSATGAINGIKEMKSSNKTVADTMNDWEKLWHEFQRFSGFIEGDEDSRNDLFNCKFISRVFTKGPYGWSDWGYTGYNGGNTQRRDSSVFKNIVKPFALGDDWLFYHEWGHNINNSLTEEVEITNNLYSAEMRRLFGTGGGEGDRIDWNTLYSRFSGNTVSQGFWTNLGMISQPLYYYGTDIYGKASRVTRTNPDGILNGLSNNKQRLVIAYSVATGYDLTDFFSGWGYCQATDLMKSKVSNLPKPTVKLEYMNTSGIGYKGVGFTEETNVNINSFSVNSELKQATIKFSVDEKNKNDVMGYEILRNGQVVGYTVNNSFTDKNIDVNENYTYEVVAYAKNLTTSKKVSIQSKTPTLLVNEKITLKLNEEFKPLDYVNAFDYVGTKIDDIKVTNNVDTSKKGIYNVTYEIISNNIKVTKETVVEVVSDYEYLSDSDWKSARTDWKVVRKDKASSETNIKLLVNGEVKEFAKGIGTHANSEIVYNLEGSNYEYFETYLGVDRNIVSQNDSSVIFKIYVDGVEVYNSGLMKYNTEAKFVRIPVKDVKELKLVADNAGNGNAYDHADFADAKFLVTSSKPKLTIPESMSTTLGQPIDINQAYSASDIEDGDLTGKVKVEESVNFDKTGKYPITYTVVDSDGNTVSKTRTIAVVDMNDFSYLSDLDWKSVNYSYTTPVKDKGVNWGAISLTNENGSAKTFEKGIGSHATSTIVYDLTDKNYAYFTSYVGVTRNMYNSIASIGFDVYVDGVLKYSSGLMTSNMPMKFVKVDINDAKELKLVVNDGGNGIGSDHGAWGDAKLHLANENGAFIDRTELDSLIKTISELDSKLYSEESFKNLTTVLENVNANLKDGYTQEEINTLCASLKEAYNKLVKLTDYSSLKTVIEENSKLNELNYTKEAITAHKELIEEGKKVLANENATQEEVDTILNKINESAKNLVVRQNKVELENKLKEAKLIENKNYQEVRWNNFLWAIDYANNIYNNIDATDKEISSALFTLEYCKGELK